MVDGIRFAGILLQSFGQIYEKYGKEQGENILDNCQSWLYLKTANQNTATEISKKLGTYTTSVHSASNSQSESIKSINTSIGNSENLSSRPLLTVDEVLRIERPYVLVMSAGKYPTMMNLPDLHKWYFNQLFGMGDPEHNRKLREKREQEREVQEVHKMKLWDISQYLKTNDSLDEYMNNDLWG